MDQAGPGSGFRVLSLDGPPFAAAALSEPFFLQQIAHRWAFNEDDEDGIEGDDVCVSEMFDLIGGSGIGGLYAILFARLNMTIGQVIEFHNILQKKLFAADSWVRKDHQECTKAFDIALDYMVSSSLIVPADLNSPFFSTDCKKCYIVVLNETKANTSLPRALRTYKVRAGSSPRCTIRQALHATLADLEHFPAVSIGDEEFIGASSVFPNASHLLVKELNAAFPKLELACFVNLGADSTRPTNDSHRVGQDLMSQFRDLDCFFRLSLKEELHAESRIVTLVMGHLQEDGISKIVDKIVDAVQSREPVVNMLRLGNLAGEDGENKVVKAVSSLCNDAEIKRALEKIRSLYNFQPASEHGCLTGTREDVLNPIESWAKDDNASNIFWLEGYPGTGKTAISISLKQRLAEARRLGASCFFRREEASQHTLSALFRSIASQLADNHESLQDSISHAVNSGSVTLESAPSIVFEKLVFDPLVAASSCCNEPIVVIIDAMDEYGRSEEERLGLVKILLPAWIQLPRQYKLFIASRSQGDLPLHLDLPSHIVRRLEVGTMSSINTQNDIRRFLEHNFEEIRNSRGNSSAFVTSSELDQLVAASAGLFIWASTVVGMVRSFRTNARHILRDLRDKGTTIGETNMDALYQLYSTVLQPLLKDNRSPVSFLSAVLCAKMPLSATALSLLCQLDMYDIEDTARQLGPVMDTANGLRFVHKSFVDYITSPYSPVKLNVDRAELMFAASCFEIMHKQLHFNMGKIPSSYMLNSEVPKLYEALSGELGYASQFWGTHVTCLWKGGKDEIFTLAKKADDFLNHHFLYWLEAVSILGCFREAMQGLSTLRVAGVETVSRFAHDALAFLRQFALPISQSYPHIYVSAVPWAPAASLIRMRYFNKGPKMLKVVANGDERWPVQLAVIRGHTGSVSSVAFSPDGFRVVSGSNDSTIGIWDATTCQLIGAPLRGHNGWVNSVAFSPDGSQIISGSRDRSIRIWDAVTRQPIGEPLRGHKDWVNSVAFSPNGSQIVSGSDDRTVRIWDAATRQPLGEPLHGHIGWVNSVAFSPDGSQIVSASDDTTIRIWDAATRQPVGEPLRSHNDSVNSVAFSPDGSQIVSASNDNTIRIWDAATRQPVGQRLRGHNDSVKSVAFSPNGSHIISGSNDRNIRIWDAVTRLPIGQRLRSHSGRVNSVAVSPDGSQIISASNDNTIRIWDALTIQSLGEPLRGPDSWVNSVAFSPNGAQIISGSRDHSIRIWDAATRQLVGVPLRGHESWVNSVTFSPDGSQIVSGSDDNTIRIWDAVTRQPVGEPLRGHYGQVNSILFFPDGSRIISGSKDRTIRIWDAVTRQPLGRPIRGHDDSVTSVTFSPDGSQIISGSRDHTIRIWDAATRQPIGEPLRGHKDCVNSVAFSPEGSQIVSGSDDRTIRIWDAATRQPIGEPLRGHKGSVKSVAFSPNGSQIVSGSKDRTIRIWDAVTRQPVGQRLRGHSGRVNSVAVSPNGSQIVSASNDNTIRIWDATTRQLVGEPRKFLKRLSFPRVSYASPLHCFLLDDGWVIDRYNSRLVWVPQHLHEFLPTPGLLDIIGTGRMVVVDASDMQTGTEWSLCADNS